MNLSSFSPTQETSPQLSKIEQEKRVALQMVLSMLEDKHKQIGEVTTVLSLSGKERALRAGSSSDLVAGKAQVLHRASENVLNEVKGVHYRQEEAAAKLEEFLGVYEVLAKRYAELLENDPSIVDRLAKLDPNLNLLKRVVTDSPANDETFDSATGANLDAKYRAS